MGQRLLVWLLLIPLYTSAAGFYQSHSVLSYGRWYQVAVRHTGIHTVTYEDLVTLGMEPDGLNSANIRIYGNGGGMLPEANSANRIDDLREVSIEMHDGNDGHFDPGDYFLFYGEAADRWILDRTTKLFSFEKNLYSDDTYYFITADLGPGKRIGLEISSTETPNSYSRRFADYAVSEKDSLNLIKSGKLWLGEVFTDSVPSHDFYFRFPDIDTLSAIRIDASLVARSPGASKFILYVNDELQEEIPMDSTDLDSYTYARQKVKGTLVNHPPDSLHIHLVYNAPDPSSVGWLDYLECNLQRFLSYTGPQMPFRDVNSVGPNKLTEFIMSGANPSVMIWDVTRPDSVLQVKDTLIGSTLKFRLGTDSLHEFIAFDGSTYFRVQPLGVIKNQDLHGLAPTELIVVTHPDFLAQALQVADFHRQHDGITISVVTTQMVYNEFASGQPDLTAIRDFVRMQYNRGGTGRPKYLLLLGDASYDYKNRVPGNTNFVPAFESAQSLVTATTFVTDDYFGIFGSGEGTEANGTLEIGVGRFPVATTAEAQDMADKLEEYTASNDTTLGPWRNRIAFVADDEEGNLFVRQEEQLAAISSDDSPVFNSQKIYSDAYPLTVTPSGPRYPDVNNALREAVNQGSLIVNYTGHGGEDGWSAEKILTIPDIETWSNRGRYPVFFTATCEFSRFDNPERFSAGELLVTRAHSGAMALLTTTRLAFALTNFGLDTTFFNHLKEQDNSGRYPCLGDLIRLCKNENHNTGYIKNFALLGDPALRISYPQYQINLTQVNGVAAGASDTATGLSPVHLKGQVTDDQGNVVNDFNGIVHVSVFDKPIVCQTLGNQPGSFVQQFLDQTTVLSEGTSTVTAGTFEYSFLVPLDVQLAMGHGKVSLYARSSQSDAAGLYDGLVLGGRNPEIDPENQGPDIRLYMDDRSFVNGGKTGRDPLLLADLSDPQGINHTGTGFGHEILAVLDGKEANPVVLNDWYTPDTDTYQSGTVAWLTGELSIGRHTLSLKAWDLYNNVSEASITFFVFEIPQTGLSQVQNIPNPFHSGTTFYLSAAASGDFTIYVYTLQGQLVKTLTGHYEPAISFGGIPWDGADQNGDPLPDGIYPCQVRFDGTDGGSSSTSIKVFIQR